MYVTLHKLIREVLIICFFKKYGCSKTPDTWTNAHEKSKKSRNSYKLAYKCENMPKIVRLYVNFSQLNTEDLIKFL